MKGTRLLTAVAHVDQRERDIKADEQATCSCSRQSTPPTATPPPDALMRSMLSMMLTRLAFLCLVILAGQRQVAMAQNKTFINALLGKLDGMGLTNFTSMIRHVQPDTDYEDFFAYVSNSSTPSTLFAPTNVACAYLVSRLMLVRFLTIVA